MSVNSKSFLYISNLLLFRSFGFKTIFFPFCPPSLYPIFLKVPVVKLFKNHRALRSPDGFSEDYNVI